jgi:beta-lactamase regulating signal transducer with metallopeptidase domain
MTTLLTHVSALDLAVKSTVLLALALLAARALRHRSAAALRHLILFTSLLGLLVLPLLSAAMPDWRVLPRWENGGAIPARESNALTARSVVATPRPVTDAPVELPPATSDPSRPHVLLIAYLVGVVVFASPLFAGAVALHLLKRRVTPLDTDFWPRLLQQSVGALSLRRRVTLLQGDHSTLMPMTWGLLGSAKILLPQSAAEWSAQRRRLVLAHELAHVKRRDSLTQFIARLVCALWWFHPLAWLTARRLRIEAELACDDLVLSATSDARPTVYADELLDIATTLQRPGWSTGAAAIAMARGNNSQLRERVVAILDASRRRRSISRTASLAVVAMVVSAVVPLSMIAARADDTTAAAAAAGAGATAAHLPAGVNVADFPHVVKFDLGETQFLPGDSITITEIRGTADTVTPNNTYMIRGRFTLASAEHADLSTYVTAIDREQHHDAYDQRQTVRLDKGSGTFTVVLPFLSKGCPHLSFYPTEGGSSFSALYFGSGESLLKPQPQAQSVTILVSPTNISFEGTPTTWDDLPAMMQKVPNRPGTILAFALSSDEMTIKQHNEALARVVELAHRFHFRYASDTGIKAAPPPASEPGGL